MKANKKPPEIMKLTLDALAIYFNLKLVPIAVQYDLEITRGTTINFWKNSFEDSGKFILGPGFDFLKNLKTYDKDAISPEIIELLEPLIVTGSEWFNDTTAGKVSKAIAAICKWLFAVYEYYEKSQIVKPKRIKLAQEEANLSIAQEKLEKSRKELAIITDKLNKLKENSQKQLDIKNELEAQAAKTKKKINTAETLINSLSGERARWKKGASEINNEKKRLVGNASLATAFISYCGPFNAEFRELLAVEKFTADMKQKDIPNLSTLAYELTNFLVDDATVG
jgi:dynein heavy chain